MSDLSITAASVKPTASTRIQHGRAGATVTAGQAAYREAASGKLKLADNDSATAEVRAIAGITLHGASDDQPLAIAIGGDLTFPSVLTAGVEYYLSGTPGGICPRADVTTGDDPIRIGIATSATNLRLDFADPNVTL
ncbi:MAG: hypothetical protein J0H54_09255 [Rhizobiales bacterium]|nr:hypothetical protein [Hyphomicrobiales bacterium]